MSGSSTRSSFGPLALLGVGSAALVALASAKVWVSPTLLLNGRAIAADPRSADVGSLPLAGALGLVLLATWGVVLVTRGRVRRAVGVLALLVAVGLVACAVAGFVSLPGDVREHFATQTGSGGYRLTLARTPWLWTAALAAVVALAVTAVSVLRMGSWPEMGQRYDAPAGSVEAPASAVPIGERDEREIWRAIDEGDDPTDPSGPPEPSDLRGDR